MQSNREDLKNDLMRELGIDQLNTSYFLALYRKYKQGSESGELPLFIHEPNVKSSGDVTEVFPTAIATEAQMKHLPAVHYRDLISSGGKNKASSAALWIKKMQAGTGSSMTRSSYLAKELGIPLKNVKIGAKGTDLFISLGEEHKISIAEAQILQAFADEKQGHFGQLILHDIISNETEESINAIWSKKSLVEPSFDYRALVEKSKGVRYFGHSYQYHIPTVGQDGTVSFNRMAPGGHALFGVDALMAAYRSEMRPDVGNLSLISSVGNGEDLSSSPDEYMVHWMVEKEIPIAMVTTTKTNNDMKGGQIAIVMPKDRPPYISMMEKAQAESANQLPLFESLGLRKGDQEAFFNTNMILLNYSALTPKIEKLVSEIGEDAFLQIISPDLILNKKKQKDSDGVERTYTQLEGAMGTVVLNLDRYWREHYGEPIVHFLNVDAMNRTKFFCPIKTAFDYFMQFHSDRFAFDQKSYRLINLCPGSLPLINLSHAIYKDVLPVLDAFSQAKIKRLVDLDVSGEVDFSGIELVGEVKIVNNGERIHLGPFADDGVIRDAQITA